MDREKMKAREILPFARANFESYAFSIYQNSYRCSVRLVDGTVLPNVLICEDGDYVNHTLEQIEHGRRQDEGRNRDHPKEQYKRLRGQLTGINSVSPHDVREIMPSPNAIPYKVIAKDLLFTRSEANYRLVFSDGKQLKLTTHIGCQFLNLPAEYGVSDVREVSEIYEEDQTYECLDCCCFYCFATDWEKLDRFAIGN